MLAAAVLLVAVPSIAAVEPAGAADCVVVEEHRFDFDEDGRLDTLYLLQEADEALIFPDSAAALLFQLTRHGAQEVSALGYSWRGFEVAQSETGGGFSRAANLLDSSLVFLQRFGPAGGLLFLFHAGGEGRLGGLSILSVGREGVRLYYDSPEFLFGELVPPRADRRWLLTGFESSTELFECRGGEATFYRPLVVYRLDRAIALDERATERLNRRLLGGYRGPRGRDDVVVLRPPGGSPTLRPAADCPLAPSPAAPPP